MSINFGWRANKWTGDRVGPTEKFTTCPTATLIAARLWRRPAERLGIYLLHPPEHSSVLLANAQQDWLRSTGTNCGWFAVDSPLKAQRLANQGELVVVTCKNSNPKRPGHIAVVRPSAKDDASIQSEGPEITQAGLHNYIDTNAKEGFKNHPGAFEKQELLYFAHVVPLLPAQAARAWSKMNDEQRARFHGDELFPGGFLGLLPCCLAGKPRQAAHLPERRRAGSITVPKQGPQVSR